MGLLSPLFLLGALAAAVPVVLHLLRREPDTTVKFAAVDMLQHAPVEHAEQRRLRELLLLALRVTALLLLALAFARPFLASGVAASATGVTIVALDTSFSLSAPGRFGRAQQLARDAIGQAPRGHLVGVVTFADVAQAVQAPTADHALAVRAIDAARVGYGATRYRAALSAAVDAVGDREGRVVVVTDLQTGGWDRGDEVRMPSRVQLDVADVGPLPANVAIVDARLAGDRVLATVRNGSDEPRDVRVRLSVDAAAVSDAVASIGENQTAEVALATGKGASAEVSIDDPEGIQADNVRYLVLTATPRPLVLVLSNAGDLGRDAFYVQQALMAVGADGAAFDVAGASGAQVSGWDAATLTRHVAIVVTSTRGLDQRGRELIADYVRQGGGVLIAASPDVDAQVAAGAIGITFDLTTTALSAGDAPRTLAPADLRHPIFRTFSTEVATLGLVRFRRIAAIRGAECQPLARFSSGETALAECASGEGAALVFASDLDSRWNDFPLHSTFVPFLHETVRYLGARGSQASSYLVGDTPAGVAPEPGFRTLPAPGGGGGRPIAVNVDGSEADPTRLTADGFRAAVTRVPDASAGDGTTPSLEARQQEEQQSLWRYAILLMIAVLVTESVIAARTA